MYNLSLTVPCDWEWGEYGDCTVTCGGETQTRVPRIITPGQHGGHCPQHVTDGVPETRSCNTATCPCKPAFVEAYHSQT